jgi:hypothetical protein
MGSCRLLWQTRMKTTVNLLRHKPHELRLLMEVLPRQLRRSAFLLFWIGVRSLACAMRSRAYRITATIWTDVSSRTPYNRLNSSGLRCFT